LSKLRHHDLPRG
jgi:hypothetical protein